MNDHQHALAWAATVIPFTGATLVKDNPWGFIYKLTAKGKAVFFLKCERHRHAREFMILPLLSKRFPGHVPQQLASLPAKKYQLLHAVDTRPRSVPRIHHLLEVYGNIQASGMHDSIPRLKKINHRAQLKRLLLALTDGNTPEHRTLQQVLGKKKLTALAATFSAGHTRTGGLIALAQTLPPVFSHNDLHMGNTSLDKKGNVIIYDWSDALIAPLGHCLSTIIGPVTLFEMLILDKYKRTKLREAVLRYLARFIPGHLSMAVRYALVGSAMAGTVSNCLLLLDFPITSHSQKEYYKGQVESAIVHLLEIAMHPATAGFLRDRR